MSWIEQIKKDLEIQTGDGKKYKPQWISASNSTDYNLTTFEFPNIAGSLVDRRLPKGRKFPLELYFQGEEHLTTAEAFRISANDPRAWTLTHPLYGRLIVQPLSLEINNDKLNVSIIKTEVVETITEDYPKTSVVAKDKIVNAVDDCNELLSSASITAMQSVGVKPLTINKFTALTKKVTAKVNKVIKKSSDFQKFTNNLNKATSAINKLNSYSQMATNYKNDAMQYSQAVIKTVSELEISVKEKTEIYKNLIEDTKSSFLTANVDIVDKIMYMSNGACILSSMCLSVINPLISDFSSRKDVIDTIDILILSNNLFIETLNENQSTNGNSLDSFIPDAAAIFSLNAVLNFTISNLFDIALNAKQERTFILEEDSNWILLAHRLYGLKADDSTINELIRNNNAGLNEMLQVKKNRKIVYYI